jgi:ATP-binding cassette, subfamily C (CFTR/MRP), member 1
VRINGDFTWETVLGDKKEKGKAEEKSDKKLKDEVHSKRKKSKKTKSQNVLPSTIDESKITEKDENTEKEEPPFSFSDLRFEVPKGAFIAIVGRVGCGKVSWEVTSPLFDSLIL